MRCRRRFRHRLDAPTAPLKKGNTSSITYLDKGASYSLLVEDTSPLPGSALYSTSVHIAFDTESQRQDPAASWHLWDRNRGADEGHVFDGKFQAIECVGTCNSENPDQFCNIQRVHSDGFSVVWAADSEFSKRCSMTIQLNFLSTDFSHVKGVHGSTMRLCCKTEDISINALQPFNTIPEMTYCKIQMYRLHGAERKAASDLASVGKRIARLKQQLTIFQQHPAKSQKKASKIKKETSEDFKAALDDERDRQENSLRSEIEDLEKLSEGAHPHSILDQQGEEQQHWDWYPRKRKHHHLIRLELETKHKSTDVITMPQSPRKFMFPTSANSRRQHDETTALSSAKETTPKVKADRRVACLYVCSKGNSRYLPIYLTEFTARELVKQVSAAVTDVRRAKDTSWDLSSTCLPQQFLEFELEF